MKLKRKNETEVRAIRFPLKLIKILSGIAERNGRTLAREIIHRLTESLRNT